MSLIPEQPTTEYDIAFFNGQWLVIRKSAPIVRGDAYWSEELVAPSQHMAWKVARALTFYKEHHPGVTWEHEIDGDEL